MSVFVVISPEPSNQRLQKQIKALYPNDHYELYSNQWLLNSENETSREISEKLGINSDNANENTGPAIVFAVSGYWGRTDPTIWEWIKIKWQKS